MRIDVISDTVCPWCYIGKRRLDRALAESSAAQAMVVWHPFQLNPDMPAAGMDRGEYLALKFGSESRARNAYRMVAEAAERETLGFNLDAIKRTPNTLDSHRLIHHAGSCSAQTQERVVEALFQAYFVDGADIGDAEVLAAVAGSCGLDANAIRARLAGDADRALVQKHDSQARAANIRGVPCFIIDGRYAIHGAQEPEVLRQVFAVAQAERTPDPVPARAAPVLTSV